LVIFEDIPNDNEIVHRAPFPNFVGPPIVVARKADICLDLF
jgi:hypothetical protein